MDITKKPTETVFIEIIPQSLYGSLIELKIRVQSENLSGEYQIQLPNNYKIVSIDSDNQITFSQNEKHNIITIVYQNFFCSITFEIGRIDEEQKGGRSCDDSGWDLYPLMSNELNFPLRVSPYNKLTTKLIFPENCHGYAHEEFSYITISDDSGIKKYHLPEEETENSPYRLKTSMVGYPNTKLMYYCIDESRGSNTDIEVQTYFREAFIFHIISIFTPILYGIPIIALWAYNAPDFDASKKIPIMIAVIPFYIGLWYKSNILKSVPMITNFLTALYALLYTLFVIYAVLLSYFNELKWFLFMAYGAFMFFVFVLVIKFSKQPVQKSKFLRRVQKIISFFLKPYQYLVKHS
ncbi:hypothetical protein [Desulfocicer niacini]